MKGEEGRERKRENYRKWKEKEEVRIRIFWAWTVGEKNREKRQSRMVNKSKGHFQNI